MMLYNIIFISLKCIFRFLMYFYLLEFYLFNIISYLCLNKNKNISYIIFLKIFKFDKIKIWKMNSDL